MPDKISSKEATAAGKAAAFQTTRWSRVALAGDSSHPDAHEALSGLCRDYWQPLYNFARRGGHSQEDAEDLTQGFILRLLEKESIAAADRERGRFRTFLIGAFSNHIANHHRDRSAKKRGGGVATWSLDQDPEAGFRDAAVDDATPELCYERSWAHALLERVMKRIQQEYEEAGRAALLEVIQPHLSGGENRVAYAQLAEKLGMSEQSVAVAVHRMRRRYGALLREEVAETVATDSEIEDELRHLIKIVSAFPDKP